MRKLAAIVLAGGKGTRMKSEKPKVLHTVAGKPMLYYPLRALASLGVKPVVCVVGHGAEDVKAAFKGESASFVTQSPQLGTAHAVSVALKELKGFSGDVLILSGDVPLIEKATISALVKLHRRGPKGSRPLLSLVTAIVEDPAGYGRIVRDAAGDVTSIVEHKDARAAVRQVREINCGVYLVDADFLKKNIKRIKTGNKQGEYYLTDLVEMAQGKGSARALTHLDSAELMGINNRLEMSVAEARMRERINQILMLSGVTMRDPATTYIDYGVKVEADTIIHPGAHLLGETTIKEGAIIEEGVRIIDSFVGRGTIVRSNSVVESSVVGRDVSLGPSARLRPGNLIKDGARIGNFVEVKNSVIGKGVKAGHLSYIGDTDIGKGANLGAGTIICNYDGKKKYRTVIREGAFIGSDSQLVAPVTIGKNAYIGSGSTITKDVPAGSLSLSRAEQRTLKGWVEKSGKLK